MHRRSTFRVRHYSAIDGRCHGGKERPRLSLGATAGQGPEISMCRTTIRTSHESASRCRMPLGYWHLAKREPRRFAGRRTFRQTSQRNRGNETMILFRSYLAAGAVVMSAAACTPQPPPPPPSPAVASAVQQLPPGRVYVFHSTAQSSCPALDWHVVLTPDGALDGVIAWNNMQSLAHASGSLNAQSRTFQMTALEVGGQHRTATINGTVAQNGYLVANISAPNLNCQGITVPWFVPPPASQ